MTPKKAYRYAYKNKGSDKLREICCGDARYAYLYAIDVDKCPREDTRKMACKDPWHAYNYAVWIDRSPREDTRLGSCKSSLHAYCYALDVDKGYHVETRRSCYKTIRFYSLYLRFLLKSKYYEESKIVPEIKRVNHDS